MLTSLLDEVYAALNGGQLRLAVMGIRSFLERMMIYKVGDLRRFDLHLGAFCDQGFASTVQKEALAAILDAGHAVTHRAYVPSRKDLNVALDITEGIFAAIHVHPERAGSLAKRIPPRQPRTKKS